MSFLNTHSLVNPLRLTNSLGFLFVLSSSSVYAIEFNTENSNSEDVMEIEVRDTRGSYQGAEPIASTTLITREEIEATGATDISQVLRGVAGIQVSQNGGPGSLTSIFMRGSEADSTLILLNDVKIQSLNNGLSAVQDIPVDIIDRIEVVRGSSSALYGSSSPGGMIRIYTNENSTRTQQSLQLGASSEQATRSTLSAQTTQGNFTYSGRLNWNQGNGYNSCQNFNACFTNELDQDSYERNGAQLAAKYNGDQGQTFELSHLYTKNRVEFDGSFQNETNSVRNVTSLSSHLPMNYWSSIDFQLGRSNEESTNFLDGSQYPDDPAIPNSTEEAGFFDTEAKSGSVILNLTQGARSGDSQTSFITGVDYLNSELESDSVFNRTQRDNLALFGEGQWKSDAATIRLSGRRDQYTESADNTDEADTYATTGSLKLAFNIAPRWTLKQSLGTSYSLPTFNDLYFPFGSNPDLEPEESISQEIGLEYSGDIYTASVFTYRTQSKNLITLVGANFTPENVSEAEINGLEFIQKWTPDNWQIQTNLAYTDAENKTGVIGDGADATPSLAGNQLARRPQLTFAGDVFYQAIGNTWHLGIFSTDERFDDSANTNELPGFVTYEIGVRRQFNEHFQAGVRVENLNDKEYQTVLGYPQPERTLWLDVKLTNF